MNGRMAVLTLCAFGILGLQDLNAVSSGLRHGVDSTVSRS